MSRAARPRPVARAGIPALTAALALAAVGPAGAAVGDAQIPGLPDPPVYVVLRTRQPVVVDGLLDDPAWALAPRTTAWQWLDTGEAADLPTYGQMTWDDEFLYFAFRTRDRDVWSTMLVRDEPVFTEEDFEIFLDPDGDEYHYYEWQINPLGTLYDVVWVRPDHTPGPAARGDFAFDLTPMRSAHRVRGTVWERADADSGWTAEVALSWAGLGRIPGRFRCPPQPGDSWRIGFSRVEVPGPPAWPADWTWPIHGEYNMHIGQRDAFVQFSGQPLGDPDPQPLPIPQLRGLEVRVETDDGDDRIQPGESFALVPRLGNRGTADAVGVEARLVCQDSLVAVLDSAVAVGSVPRGGDAWAGEGFRARLSQAAGPGRTLLFHLFLTDAAGRWWGDYFFAFAAGRGWRTVAQTHEGVRELLIAGDEVWALSVPNLWRWRTDGTLLGFYQPDDGLARHPARLERDGSGRVWTAGHRGLACFDGSRWTNLTGQQGLPDRDVDALAAAPDGAMWIGTRAGLFRAGRGAGGVEAVWPSALGFAPRRVAALRVDGRGVVWAVTDTLLHLVGRGGAGPPGDAVAGGGGWERRVLAGRHGLPSNRLTAVAQDGAGRVWVAGVPTAARYRDGGVGCWDGAAWRVWRAADGLASDEVTALFVDAADRVWAGHPDGALSVFDGQRWDRWPGDGSDACRAPGNAQAPCVGPVHDLAQDGAGRVWLVGRDGVARWQDGQWRTWTERRGLFGQRATAVAVDGQGRAWLGDDRSLSRYEE